MIAPVASIRLTILGSIAMANARPHPDGAGGHFMCALVGDDTTWQRWAGRMPVIVDTQPGPDPANGPAGARPRPVADILLQQWRATAHHRGADEQRATTDGHDRTDP